MQLNEAIKLALGMDRGMIVLVGDDYKPYEERSVAAYLEGKVIYRVSLGMASRAVWDLGKCVEQILEEIGTPLTTQVMSREKE